MPFFFSHSTYAENKAMTRIASQNIYNFYNDQADGKKEKVLSKQNYQLRLKRISQHIFSTLKSPDIIALQEIENLATLSDINKILKLKYQLCYQAVLLEGHKKVAINVAYLIQCDWEIKNLSPLFKNINVKKYNKTLFTRPPLYLNICKKTQCLDLVNVHLRSMRGLKNKRKAPYVAQKRLQQAEHLAQWVNQFQTQWPDKYLMLLGDFNALSVSDHFVDVLGIIKGKPSRLNAVYPAQDYVQRDLFDLSLNIPSLQRFSYRYKKKKQILDYMLVSKNVISTLKSIHFSSIDYQISDHAALIAEFYF